MSDPAPRPHDVAPTDAVDGDDEPARAPNLVLRAAFFAVLFVAAAAWVSANDGEHANAARHFLRQLLRHLF